MTDEPSGTPDIQEMLEHVRSGKLSRRAFILGLTAVGVTGAGAAAILHSATQHPAAAAPQQHLQQHDQHISHQTTGNVQGMSADYADNAVVDDPLFARPFVGREAISQRFAAEVASVPDRELTILNRAVIGNQLVVEWEARGTHTQPFLGIGGNGQRYVLRGTTIVTRHNGKIVRESHYFDTHELLRQIAY